MHEEEFEPAHEHCYEIRVRGQLGELTRHGFPDLDVQSCGDDTLLSGALPDQSALHGVLTQIESLALELLEVRRLPFGSPRSDRIDRRVSKEAHDDCTRSDAQTNRPRLDGHA